MLKYKQFGKNVIQTNSNSVLLEEGETFDLSANIDYFNLFRDITAEIEFESGDTSLVTINEETGEMTAIKEGTAYVIAKEIGANNIAVIKVRILKSGTAINGIKIEPKVDTNGSSTVMLKVDGSVWTYGGNSYGELGNGTNTYSDDPVKAAFPNGTVIKDIAIGTSHMIALDTEGNVWTWGRNDYYQLGITNVAYSNVPVKLTGLSKITQISTGNYNSFAITEEKEVYVWGLNSNGEAGVGSYTNKITPRKAKYLTDVIDIQGGRNHSIALKSTGEVLVTGSNLYGELGIDRDELRRSDMFIKQANLSHIVTVDSGDSNNIVADHSGKVYTFGSNIYGGLGTGDKINREIPVQIPNLSNIRSVSAGKTHTIALDKNGEAYVTGTNLNGQLGIGTTENKLNFEKNTNLSNVIDIRAGETYSVLLKNNGEVYGFGDYNHGDILLKSKTNSRVPVLVGNDEIGLKDNEIVLRIDETKDISAEYIDKFNLIYLNNDFKSSLTFETLNENIATTSEVGIVKGISTGTTWAKATDGTGKDYIVMVRVIEKDMKTAPKVSAGEHFTGVLKADGTIWTFGYNGNGELADGTNISKDVPKQANVIETYRDLAVR